MQICNCSVDIPAILCDIPVKWRKDITKALCFVLQDDETNCDLINQCQTVTSLSPFNLTENILSVTFKDEKGVSVTRTVDISEALNNILDEVNPSCIMSSEEWALLTTEERLQVIIDEHCVCCPEVTTTSSTTTTTTIPSCTCRTYNIENLSGEDVQMFYVDCETEEQLAIIVPNGVTTQICGCSIIDPEIAEFTVLDIGEGCSATTTTSTSTTTSSTTTTSTITTTSTTTTSSTTTTTTEAPCICHTYTVSNETGFTQYVSYITCDDQFALLAIGDSLLVDFCACYGSVVAEPLLGLIVTDIGEGCNLTTTSTSTTTTTTLVPTTTSTSTTTTTTEAPANFRIWHEGTDMEVTNAKVDTIPVPDIIFPVDFPEDVYGYHIGAGLVDVEVTWTYTDTDQRIEILDSNGAFFGCASSTQTSPFTFSGVDSSGVQPITVHIVIGEICP